MAHNEKTDENGLEKVTHKDITPPNLSARGPYHSIANFIAGFYPKDRTRHRKNKGGITWHLSTNAQVKQG
jgi:hypothetical protein